MKKDVQYMGVESLFLLLSFALHFLDIKDKSFIK